MDPFTAALVLASAALHPLWYALVKRDPDPHAAFIGLNAGLALIALVPALPREGPPRPARPPRLVGARAPRAMGTRWPTLLIMPRTDGVSSSVRWRCIGLRARGR